MRSKPSPAFSRHAGYAARNASRAARFSSSLSHSAMRMASGKNTTTGCSQQKLQPSSQAIFRLRLLAEAARASQPRSTFACRVPVRISAS